jgi:hypothetical protein
MRFKNKRDRIEATAAPHLDREENLGVPKARGKGHDDKEENRRKQQDKACLSLSPSHVRVEVRGGLRCETNLWRKYGRAVVFL